MCALPAAAALTADDDKLREAHKDLIECRDVPEADEPKVLVATGDSVTSAFHQFGFGIGKCDNVSSDGRNLKGNSAMFSYVGQYLQRTRDIHKYYNFARSGFGTDEMVGNLTYYQGDTCENPWKRKYPPMRLAQEVIRKAKEDGLGAYFVTTGGANDTNWVEVLVSVTKCRGLEYLRGLLDGRANFTWGRYGKEKIITHGGVCQLAIDIDEDRIWIWRSKVPAYDGPDKYAMISRNAKQIVQTMLDAGADRVLWLLYYDITPAHIDIANLAYRLLLGHIPEWIQGYFPPETDPLLIKLIDPVHKAAVQKMVEDLNTAITKDMPTDRRLGRLYPAVPKVEHIQVTALGGCPHPSQVGHAKYADFLSAVLSN